MKPHTGCRLSAAAASALALVAAMTAPAPLRSDAGRIAAAAAAPAAVAAAASAEAAAAVSAAAPKAAPAARVFAAARPAPEQAGHEHALPVAFVPNHGQYAGVVRFAAVVGDATLFLTDGGLTFVSHGAALQGDPTGAGAGAQDTPAVMHLRFEGVGPGARMVPGPRLPGVAHFLRGNDPSAWITNVPTFAGVTVRGLYRGIDLTLEPVGAGLAIAVHAAAGVDPATVRLRYVDERGSRVSESAAREWLESTAGVVTPAPGGNPEAAGTLVGIGTPALGGHPEATGTLARIGAPALGGHPEAANAAPAPGSPANSPDAAPPSGTIHQAPGTPTLVYSTFLGGRTSDLARGLAVDAAGYAYIAGTTTSVDYPTRAPIQSGLGNSGNFQDAFVAKLDPTGTQLVYSTYLGGQRQDEAFALAVDAVGRAHIAGYTTSPDFPTARPIQPKLHLAEGIFSGDTFIARLRPDGGGLEFSTFLGGTARDVAKGIAVDDAGFVYVAGWTGSNFPAFKAIHPLNRGVRDAFIAKLTPDGDKVVYSTHLGGSYADDAKGVAVDAAGNAYIVGTTESLNFQVVAPYQRVIAGDTDAFVAKINADGSAFDYATYLGGRGNDRGIGIAVTPNGDAYVMGQTDSPNFPRQNPFQNSRSGPTDLFVTRLSASGDALVFSTYLGGNADEASCVQPENFRDIATPTPGGRAVRYLEGSKFTDGPVGAIRVDPAGRVHVASCTSSANLPLVRPIVNRRGGAFAAMAAVFDPTGSNLLFGTYLGGRSMNVARALAVGIDGAIYVAGQTDATDFPTVPMPGALQPSRSGTDDAFVLKIGIALDAAPTLTPIPRTHTPTASPSASPSATITTVATHTAEATPTDELTPSPTADTTATSPGSPAPSGTPTASSTPVPTATSTTRPGPGPIYLPIAHRH